MATAPYLLLAHPPTTSVHLLAIPGLTQHATAHGNVVPAHAVSVSSSQHQHSSAPPLLFCAQAARPTIAAFRLSQQNTLVETAKHPAPEKITSLAASPQGSFLVAGSPTGKLYIWEISTGELIRMVDGHYKRVGVVRFAPGGEVVWTGGDDGAVHGWLVSDLVDRTTEVPVRPLVSFSDHTLPIVDIATTEGNLFSSWLVTASADRTVRLRSLSPLPHPPTLLTLVLPSTPTRILLPAPFLSLYIACTDGIIRRQHLYARTSDGTAEPVTEYSTGRLDFAHLLQQQTQGRAPNLAFEYPSTPSPVLSLASYQDNLYAGHADGFLTVFDLPSGIILRRIDGASYSPTIKPDNKRDNDELPKGISELAVVELAVKPGKREPATGILKRFINADPQHVVEFSGAPPVVEPEVLLWDGTEPAEETDDVSKLRAQVERLRAREELLRRANEGLFELAKSRIG